MIDQITINNVREQTDILSVISEVVSLKQEGKEYVAPCPFLDHNDAAPSFKVNPSKQIYKCFGCGKGGNVFTFLMEYNRMGFIEAVKACAMRAGIVIDEYKVTQQEQDRLQLMSDVHEQAALFFAEALRASESLDYLMKTRKLSAETIAEYRLGYDDGSFYSKAFVTYGQELLQFGKSLFTEAVNGSVKDKWKGRYVFPLIDTQGKVIGFSGTNESINPKYLNSPETELFSKSRFLYGLGRSKDCIIKSKGVIVVEGFFDYLSLVQAGFPNVVAVCGTALTEQHGKLLSRYAEDVVLLFDSDTAGEKAIDRSFPNLFNYGLSVYVAKCPAGLDPDKIIQSMGCQGIQHVLRDSQSWFDYRLKAESAQEKVVMVNLVKEIANEISLPEQRSLFLDVAAEKLSVQEASFSASKKSKPYYRDEYSLPNLVFDRSTELIILAGLHANPTIAIDDGIFEDEEQLSRLHKNIAAAKGNSADVYNSLNAEDSRVMSEIIFMSEKGVDVDSAVRTVTGLNLNRKIQRVLAEISEEESCDNDVSELVEQLNLLFKQRKDLVLIV